MKPEIRIAAFSRYSELGASSRVRIAQYMPHLRQEGILVEFMPLFSDRYLTELYRGRRSLSEVFKAYMKRAWQLSNESRKTDLIWLEKEALPWMPAMLEDTLLPISCPLMLDLDDAIFHQYDLHRSSLVRGLLGRKIDSLMARADIVIVGSHYLGERARKAGASRVLHLPSAVSIYPPRAKAHSSMPKEVAIGWIGSPSTAKYLRIIEPALLRISEKVSFRFICIGLQSNPFTEFQPELRPWSEETELSDLDDIDIGVMPLENGPWERGKCAYKIIQYFSRGKPAVASAVGENLHVIRHQETGFIAESISDWESLLMRLISDPELRRQMGARARNVAEELFDTRATGAALSQAIRNTVLARRQ